MELWHVLCYLYSSARAVSPDESSGWPPYVVRVRACWQTDADIADDLGLSAQTAANVRKRFAADGVEAALTEQPRSGGPALDGTAEAVRVGLACSPVPDGRTTWTARMLANKLVELEVAESVSEDTVLRVLKKATSSRGRRSRGASRRG